MSDPAPIAVFAYNRPQHLKVTLEALKRCEGYSKHPLYIFCDAPVKSDDLLLSEATRAVAHTWTNLHGGEVILRPKNFHFRNITEGITALCETHGSVIVVEDDIVVSPDFLKFMQRGLDTYRDEERVYLISGYTYPGSQPPVPTSFFLSFALIWGWATWKRAWQHYDWKPKGIDRLFRDSKMKERFDFKRGYNYSNVLKRAVSDEKVTWDIQWSFTVFRDQALMLCPSRSLVWNSGIGCGVHGHQFSEPSLEGRDRMAHGCEKREDYLEPRLPRGFVFPKEIKASEQAYLNLCRFFRRHKSRARWKRNGQKLLRLLSRNIRRSGEISAN